MSGVCPGGSTHQVYRLHEYWGGRPKESEAYRKLGPPKTPQTRYGVAAGLVLAGLLVLSSGGAGVALGVLLVATGVALGSATWRRVQDAVAAREQWGLDFYCVTCPRRFSPKSW